MPSKEDARMLKRGDSMPLVAESKSCKLSKVIKSKQASPNGIIWMEALLQINVYIGISFTLNLWVLAYDAY